MAVVLRGPDPKQLQLIARGGRLKTAMKRRGFNAPLLSVWTGISPSTIRHFLLGTRDMHLDDAQKIGSALGISPAWIVWGEK